MFERFTSNARQIVAYGAAQSRELGHEAIEPEHLLLGALELERGVAHDVLAAAALGLEQARSYVAREHGSSAPRPLVPPSSGQIPFSAASSGILRSSLEASEALEHAHPHIGSGHVLLALLAPGTASARLVDALGHDVDALRAETARLLRLDDPGS